VSIIINPYAHGAANIDPLAAFFVLLMHMDGADGSTTFTDEKGHSFTASGNAQIDTAQSVLGGASALFDGTDDKLTTSDSADWHFGSGNWTIGFRCRSLAGSNALIIGQAEDSGAGTASWGVFAAATTLISMNASTGTGSWNIAGLQTSQYQNVDFSAATWRHVEICCQYPTLWMFLDGVQYAYGTLSQAMPNAGHNLYIANSGTNANDLGGWLEEMYIIKGACRHTGGASAANNGTTYFTPDTSAIVLS